jgi:hypothetical protein
MSGYRAAVRLDAEVVRLRHQPRHDDSTCRVCGEEYPCGPGRLAERALDVFDKREDLSGAARTAVHDDGGVTPSR